MFTDNILHARQDRRTRRLIKKGWAREEREGRIAEPCVYCNCSLLAASTSTKQAAGRYELHRRGNLLNLCFQGGLVDNFVGRNKFKPPNKLVWPFSSYGVTASHFY